jgi:hypothetical protein
MPCQYHLVFVHGVISTLTNSFMINHPIGEKWKERLVKEVTDSDGRLMPLTAISFIENLLEQERKRMSDEIEKLKQYNSHIGIGGLHSADMQIVHNDAIDKALSIINK